MADQKHRVVRERPHVEQLPVCVVTERLPARFVVHHLDEERGVTGRLDGEEHPVQPQAHHDQKHFLAGRKRRAGRRLREVRHDQAEDGERHDDAEVSNDALQVVFLLAMAQAAQQQCQTDQPVQNDHHHREHCVARERRIGIARGHHDRDGQDLDARHRKREDYRAERLTEQHREAVGVTDDGHRPDHDHREQPHENEAGQHEVGEDNLPAMPEQQEDRGSDERRQCGRLAADQRQELHALPGAHRVAADLSRCGLLSARKGVLSLIIEISAQYRLVHRGEQNGLPHGGAGFFEIHFR